MKVFIKPKMDIIKFSNEVEMGVSVDPEWKSISDENKQTFNTNTKTKIVQYDFFE